MMRRSPGINGIFTPKHRVLGMEFAGDVAAVGTSVTTVRPGDPVFGNLGLALGACAEYVCLPETAALALKPTNLSYTQAAAITNGALTALPYLRELARIQAGQRILIHGASGTVGSAAVQLARYFGATVTGTCRSANVEKVRALGAQSVLDYTTTDFTTGDQVYDIVFDVAGKSSFARSKRVLAPGGIYMTTMPCLSALVHWMIPPGNNAPKARFAATGLRKPAQKALDLQVIRKAMEEAKLIAVIDREFSFEQIPDAHRHIEAGRKNGTVVIRID